nr:MAG TPA: hypothetical protein [Caudoviricetes sp.]
MKPCSIGSRAEAKPTVLSQISFATFATASHTSLTALMVSMKEIVEIEFCNQSNAELAVSHIS